MTYKLGIDVGSTTLKAVVLNDEDEIIYKSYERHKSKVREMSVEKIEELSSVLSGHDIALAITGSAGLGVADDGGFPFVQEVFASAQAVKKYYPRTDVVIELGGEDAKIIFLKGALEERMNSTCAGGTGAFIDQMASLLNVDLETMDKLSLQHTKLYPIASRCGVFAKSDVQPLINQGVEKSNLAASIFQAVVDQSIAGLAQGRNIEGNVLFLGGPLHFLKGLQERFVETLKLREGEANFPDLAPYFVALGAAVYATSETKTYTYEELSHKMKTMAKKKVVNAGLPPLFKNDQEYLDFKERHHHASVARGDIHTYTGNAYLGIDAGSTTTKLILIDEQDNILYESYTNNMGNPVDVIQKELINIYELIEDRITIAQSAVTGYGEELMKNAFRLDIGVVETIAHYTAAKHFNPNVDFIIDIGGQDMKCFRIKDNTIDDILLNEACSSGCGSFIETFAKSMGYDIQQFATMGLAGKHPVDLGTRCTVFMNSSVKQAQKNGASMEDISAGLCMSVVKNALYKVIRAKSPEDIGKEIVVQGGTFLNDTVLRSFELELGRNVIRPGIAHLMGAYGAALLAKNKYKKPSTMLSKDEVKAFTHTSQAINCGLCTNHCNLTINTFADGTKHIAGNKCERPITGKANKDKLPNLYEYKYKKLMELKSQKGRRGKIGIPLVLNMFDTLPFWHAFFTTLGYEVVLSDRSSKQLYALGQHTISSDTICYPAKLTHGHIQSLLDKGLQTIFYPCMSYNMDESMSDNHFNCPVVAYYPEVIEGNMDVQDIDFMYPYLYMNDPKTFEKKIYEYFMEHGLDVDKKEVSMATKNAYEAYYRFKDDILKEGQRALAFAQENHHKVIVLAGRPYHIDPQINHGIDRLLTNLGFVVISEDAIVKQPQRPSLHVLNQWTFHARMYNAAQFVTTQKNMELIQLVSFGCGIDAITGDEVKDILRNQGKLYTQIKIDEVDNLGAIKIRCRSLLAAMEEREEA
ncbi:MULTISPECIES: acyl-CoA dehydratase activase-related protein [Bacillota]|uniref:acyl-CoA dehydratase activase-related protein n=1 Tax=Bacillota TaxID=1239 RepID=UPI000E3F62C9|nr:MULTISPECIES: acyl-CoA dehydratase activase-related protein [Bacillota]RGB55171.1 2-hydroxyglutaryl-CoA dehydratase [Absiella sp. AM22-9]RGB62510.1 2-hydroxyglutaryl-CoA dehydratase [Absiella sp. AM09-45]RGB62800.1 2-hydroxyglutaryl-CoA dehydratase [Absiella sp. AM10-20]RGB71544.1 2-hydroxyglutaryl-CoA dehydratase [Absiella sp. AM09-50]RGC22958.1 2-hydroxyglutaryl-CoA dehydratase [Absiella sp. AM54-8XD]